MPTYQVGETVRDGARRLVPLRPLTCEQCGAALGPITAVHAHAGMNAGAVCGVFPSARPRVERHERECHETKP